MSNSVFVTGQTIYAAAVAGAVRGYNRSTDDHSKYAQMIKAHYEAMTASVVNRAVRRRIRQCTNKNWQQAYLPVQLALVHSHILGQRCEEHARVYLTTNPTLVFDIPMEHWDSMQEESRKRFSSSMPLHEANVKN